MSSRLLLVLLLAPLLACGEEVDPGIPITIFDAGNPSDLDAAELDATYPDAATGPDAADDAGDDGGADAQLDGGPDGGPDADLDGGALDAEPDTGVDGGEPDLGDLDGGGDAGPDLGLDAGPDAGLDVGVDAGLDAGPDAGPDAGYLPPPSGYQPTNIDTTFRHGQGVRLIDLDQDGDLDVVQAKSLDDAIDLYLNDGNAASFTAVNIAMPGALVAMDATAADFDGDGDVDLVGISLFQRSLGFNSPGDIVYYRNPGNPLGFWLAFPISLSSLYGMKKVESGDLSGDGIPDLVIGCDEAYDMQGNVAGVGVHMVVNGPGGSFGQPTPIDGTLGGVEVVAIADVDRDGVLDVVAAGRNDDEVVWYENLRNAGDVVALPTFARHTIANLSLPSGIAIGQVDPDVGLEIAVVQDDGTGGRLWLYDSPVDPTQLWNPTLIDGNFGGSGDNIRLALADLNRDGATDLAVASDFHDLVRAYIRQPLGAWQLQNISALTGVVAIAAGDLDGDTYPDLVTSTYEFDPNFDRLTWWRTQP
ncbi:MAG: VCBS repeat-containing protein [Deltaproteobacteria bacterium]|nr:VCBS repeat-containing protein [Deltaproteobacteria bacterium]